MAIFTPEEIDHDILIDLKEEIIELHEASENDLIELELTPNDKELQRSLFRSVHTIKGDLGLVGFTPMIEVLQYTEEILDMLRKGEVVYDSSMSGLVLGLMDEVLKFVEQCIDLGKATYDDVFIGKIVDIIKQCEPDNKSQHHGLFLQASNLIRGLDIDEEEQSEQKVELAKTGVPKNISPEKQVDLLFFRDVMRPIEKRAGHSEGRTDRMAALALYINSTAEDPIDEEQLAVACYVHDFGMAFMPHTIVTKTEPLTEEEENLLRSHVYKSTRLLEHLSHWDGARKMIMQHHEHVDGSGYPLGIKGNRICDGAKLIAILDRFVSLTVKDHDDEEVLSEKDAVIAVNKNYKGQLSANWLRVFNKAMTDFLNQ